MFKIEISVLSDVNRTHIMRISVTTLTFRSCLYLSTFHIRLQASKGF